MSEDAMEKYFEKERRLQQRRDPEADKGSKE
jgi:hypothetical protein